MDTIEHSHFSGNNLRPGESFSARASPCLACFVSTMIELEGLDGDQLIYDTVIRMQSVPIISLAESRLYLR